MAGITFGANDIEQKAGLIVQQVWDSLSNARAFYLWLADPTHSAAAIQALGVSASDDTLIRNAFGDLGGPAGLWSVSHAKFTPGGSSDYFSNAKQLTGTNYSGSAIS
jgi:hypothetical protein